MRAHRRRASADRTTPFTRSGSWVRDDPRRRRASREASQAELTVEQRGTVLVESRVRLVEHEQSRVVQEGPAEREPLRHPARIGGDALADALPRDRNARAAFRSALGARRPGRGAVEVEVLEPGQLAIDKRLVREVAELASGRLDLSVPGSGPQARDKAEQRRLATPVRAGDEQEPAGLELERDRAQSERPSVPLLDVARRISGSARSQPLSSSDEGEEDERDDAVDGEEGGVEPP